MKRFFHGNATPQQFAKTLVAEFDQGNLQTQLFGDAKQIIVQITTKEYRRSGGKTALTVTLEKIKDGVAIEVGKQSWLGVAASLGSTAISALRNPFSLLGRLDDVAQDIESLQIRDRIWEVIEDYAVATGASFELSERLRRLVCEYCDTANPVGAPSCIACGAPLGKLQPATCPHCRLRPRVPCGSHALRPSGPWEHR